MKNLLLVASTTFVSLGFVFHSCNTEIKKLISLPTMWRMQSNITQYKLTLLRKAEKYSIHALLIQKEKYNTSLPMTGALAFSRKYVVLICAYK